MTGIVIAISGGIGAGKSALAKALISALEADRVSFGDEVRKYARENGEDTEDRSVLQELGQALVMTECAAFVGRVLAQRSNPTKPVTIVEGVRHIEVLMQLRAQMGTRQVFLVHVATPGSTREQRVMERDNVERRVAARYDNDITEAQVARILPQYAALTVDGEKPTTLQVAQVMQKVRVWTGHDGTKPVAA